MMEFLNTFIKIDPKKIITSSTVFEDNNEALKLALEPKHKPRAKHACVKHHYFRQFVKNKTISIQAIEMDDQQADVMTKSLAKKSLRNLEGQS